MGCPKDLPARWEPDPDTRYVFWGETAGAGPNAFATIDERGKSSGPLVLIMLQTNNASKVAVAAKATPASPATAAFSLKERQWQGRKNSRSSAKLSVAVQCTLLDLQDLRFWLASCFVVAAYWTILTAEGTQPKPKKAALGANQSWQWTVDCRCFAFCTEACSLDGSSCCFCQGHVTQQSSTKYTRFVWLNVIRSFQMSTLARTVRVLRQNLL